MILDRRPDVASSMASRFKVSRSIPAFTTRPIWPAANNHTMTRKAVWLFLTVKSVVGLHLNKQLKGDDHECEDGHPYQWSECHLQ